MAVKRRAARSKQKPYALDIMLPDLRRLTKPLLENAMQRYEFVRVERTGTTPED